MMEILTICYEFFKTGLFAVGGGLATLPFLADMQATYQWFTAADLANMVAVSESTPGPIGINMSTYVGFTTHGIAGALAATLSLVLPSLIVIMVVAKFLDKYRQNTLIQNMFAFMRPAVTGLIAAAGFAVLKICLLKENATLLGRINWIALALFVLLTAATQWKKLSKIHPIAFIALGAVIGILLKM